MTLINPITTLLPGNGFVSNVTPFTYRDGATYLRVLEEMRAYINGTLVGSINENIDGLNTVVSGQIEDIAAILDEALTETEADKTAAEAAKAAAEAARDLAQQYAEEAGDAADAAMLTVWNNIASAFRVALDAAYVNASEFDPYKTIVDSGRLSSATLDTRFNGKVDDSELSTLVTNIDAEFADVYTGLNGKANAIDVIKEGVIDAKIAATATDSRYDVTRLAGPVGSRLTVPTHVTPAGGQATHPSLVYFPQGWNGYRYWMAYTPFPNANDDHEDPNLAVSNDGTNWVFAPGVTQPLDDADGNPEYNSDVSLVPGPDNTLYLFWRRYDSGASINQEQIFMRKSVDGVSWSARALVWESPESAARYLSPTFLWDNNRWTMWGIDRNGTPNTLVRRQWGIGVKDPIPSGIGAAVNCSVGVLQANKELWHIEIRRVGSQLIALINDTTLNTDSQNGDLLFASSTDGVTWANNANIAIPRFQAGEHDNLYKGTFIPAVVNSKVGFRVIYGAFMAAGSVWNLYETFVEYDGEVVGTFTKNTMYKDQANYNPLTLTKRGNRARLRGVVTVNSTQNYAINFSYLLGTLPVGFRPAAGKQNFRPANLSPFNLGWVTVLTSGNVEFQLMTAQTANVDAWILSVDVEFDVA